MPKIIKLLGAGLKRSFYVAFSPPSAVRPFVRPKKTSPDFARFDLKCKHLYGIDPRAEGGGRQSQEKWRAEVGEQRADIGRTTKGYGGGRRAEGEKFLLRFSTTELLAHNLN